MGPYETNVNTIRANYNFYLKHEVEDGIIESTEACLWYNNHEFCLGPNYWVETGNGGTNHESAENGIATKNKLQADMEAALETPAATCTSNWDNVYCFYGEYRCHVNSWGSVDCHQDEGDSCGIRNDESSFCE